MSGGLGVFLLRMGRRVGLANGSSRIRLITVALGTFVVIVALVAISAAFATADGRQTRMLANLARSVETGEKPAAFLKVGQFGTVDDWPVTVIAIAPVDRHSPLPPGVSKWPGPGEAVLSPQLRASLGRAAVARYGVDVGTIDTSGLETPAERRVYFRPISAVVKSAHMTPISGYGGGGVSGPGAGFVNAPPTSRVLELLVGSILLPGLVLLVVGARMGSAQRDRRMELLTAMGARARDRVLFNVGEAAIPLCLGGLAAVALAVVWLVDGIHLPWFGYVTPAADLRHSLPMMLLALVLGVVTTWATVLLARVRVRRKRGARPLTPMDPVPAKAPVVCVVAVVATTWIPFQVHDPYLKLMIYLVGLLIVCLTLPSLIAAMVAMSGRTLAGLGVARGSAATVVAARQLEARPGRTGRLVAGVVLAVIAVGQVHLWVTALDAQYQQEEVTRQAIGDSLLLNTGAASPSNSAVFLAHLPPGVSHLWFQTSRGDEFTGNLVGACRDLRAVEAPCTSQPTTVDLAHQAAQLHYLGVWFHLDHLVVSQHSDQVKGEGDTSLILASQGPGDLPREDLTRLGYRYSAGGIELERPGEGWQIAGAVLVGNGNWVLALGLLGVALLALAAGLNMLTDFVTNNDELNPLAVLAGDSRVFQISSAWKVLAPLTLAGGLGAVLYYVLPSGLARGDSPMRASVPLAVGCFAVTTLVGVLMSWRAARSAAKSAQTWHP